MGLEIIGVGFGRTGTLSMQYALNELGYPCYHIEEIKSQVPADRLLIFSVDQGWKPLCSFLGKEIPKGNFPNVNDKAENEKTD